MGGWRTYQSIVGGRKLAFHPLEETVQSDADEDLEVAGVAVGNPIKRKAQDRANAAGDEAKELKAAELVDAFAVRVDQPSDQGEEHRDGNHPLKEAGDKEGPAARRVHQGDVVVAHEEVGSPGNGVDAAGGVGDPGPALLPWDEWGGCEWVWRWLALAYPTYLLTLREEERPMPAEHRKARKKMRALRRRRSGNGCSHSR